MSFATTDHYSFDVDAPDGYAAIEIRVDAGLSAGPLEMTNARIISLGETIGAWLADELGEDVTLNGAMVTGEQRSVSLS